MSGASARPGPLGRGPGDDVLLRVLVVDQAQPDRAAACAAALGGGLDHDDVALFAGVQALDGPDGGGALQAGAEPGELGRVIDARDLLRAAAAAPADAHGGPGNTLGGHVLAGAAAHAGTFRSVVGGGSGAGDHGDSTEAAPLRTPALPPGPVGYR